MTSFEEQLRAQLVEAAGRQHRRRQRRRQVLRGAVAAVVVAGGVATASIVLDTGRAAADLTVIVRDGELVLTADDLDVGAGEVAEVLRDNGIDAEVDEQPTGPSLVGRFGRQWVFTTTLQEGRLVIGDDGAFERLSLPLDYDGQVRIIVGRASAPGEEYVLPTDAFADGEPLACTDVLGATVAEARAELAGSPELAVQVLPFDAAGVPAGPAVPLDGEASRPADDLVVTAASATAADAVLLDARPAGTTAPDSPDEPGGASC